MMRSRIALFAFAAIIMAAGTHPAIRERARAHIEKDRWNLVTIESVEFNGADVVVHGNTTNVNAAANMFENLRWDPMFVKPEMGTMRERAKSDPKVYEFDFHLTIPDVIVEFEPRQSGYRAGDAIRYAITSTSHDVTVSCIVEVNIDGEWHAASRSTPSVRLGAGVTRRATWDSTPLHRGVYRLRADIDDANGNHETATSPDFVITR